MGRLRHILLSMLLILAVMPWGAHARPGFGPLAETPGVTDQSAPPVASMLRRCHSPGLPGPLCAGDPAILAVLPDAPQVTRDEGLAPAPDWRFASIAQARALEPPRIG